MIKVFKYKFAIEDRIVIEMPIGAKVVKVDTQEGEPCLWAEVNPARTKANYHFFLYGTGHEIEEGLEHVGTFFDGSFVWHLYERGC